MSDVGIIGAGSWGTALACLLAGNGASVRIWDIDAGLLSEMGRLRENRKYLPGCPLSGGVEIALAAGECVGGADFVVSAVPAQFFRSAISDALPGISEGAYVVNVAKGIELGSLLTMSQVFAEVSGGAGGGAGKGGRVRGYAALSGPSHAEEVALGMPTTVTAASGDREAAEAVQDLFMAKNFRVYAQGDILGVELGGALKNIIALGAGISDGMGYGDNTKAALMTRGVTEMARLGVSLGARRETFFGLSGIGDLIVTCTSMHSRNRRCGILIGEGVAPGEAVEKVGMVVEGITTARAGVALAQKQGVEMPITEAICGVVNGEIPAAEALAALMGRDRRHEQEHEQEEILV